VELGPLVRELEVLAVLLCTEEAVDPRRIREAVAGAVALAPSLDQDAGRALLVAVEAMQQAAAAHQERTADRLGELRAGRRAMKGYGGLRSHKSGQRVRTKA